MYSYLALLLTNLLTIIFALTQHWPLGQVAWIYFLQSIIIGIFNVFKMASLQTFRTRERVPASNSPGVRVSNIIFFILHYSFFHLICGAFLFEDSMSLGALLLDPFFVLNFFLLVANHLFAFLSFYRQDRERNLSIDAMLFFPYIRALPMLLAAIMIVNHVIEPRFLLIFMVLKTAADLATQAIERRWFMQGARPEITK